MQHSLTKLIDKQDMQNCLFEPFTIIYNTLKYYNHKKNKKDDTDFIKSAVLFVIFCIFVGLADHF